jgi:arginine-tRNA-protein transferase
MVYSFFRPELADRSLGTFMILDHIARARAQGLPHVYLGYWIKDCERMDYKARYQPAEILQNGLWRPIAEHFAQQRFG